ncbi:MAG: hypothetical protein ACODAQ_01275 [Phycisphaeraceae bacterium]
MATNRATMNGEHHMHLFRLRALTLIGSISLLAAAPALALDDAHWAKADESIQRGIEYLRTAQNDDGSWSPDAGPAITALAVTPMLDRPDIGADDPTVAKAIDYILDHVNDDGSIHAGMLANYNTAICLSALSRVHGRSDVAEAVRGAEVFLRGLQWQTGMKDPHGETITEDHPYFGGAGYGKHGRPDLSNTQIMLQALHDAGVSCDDPVYQRAVQFITRCQGVEQNTMHGGKIQNDGGFIYSTSINKDLIGVPESKASPEQMDEALEGKPVSLLRTYGSMTYAAFKSFVYATPVQLTRDDPRITAARDWIRQNYTLQQNPGMPEGMEKQGLFYYYMTFARAMDAWGASTITTADGETRDWANDLIDQLADLQRSDGSWINDADRWMEGDPNLVTAYALIALTAATQ